MWFTGAWQPLLTITNGQTSYFNWFNISSQNLPSNFDGCLLRLFLLFHTPSMAKGAISLSWNKSKI